MPNPSALFLADREEGVAGAAVFAGMEGSRPLLVEIQALVAPSGLATPRRAVVGWDGSRLAMLLAVLEARCGLVMSTRDVYLNVAGGLRVQEPAADLAVAAAIVSARRGRPGRRRRRVLRRGRAGRRGPGGGPRRGAAEGGREAGLRAGDHAAARGQGAARRRSRFDELAGCRTWSLLRRQRRRAPSGWRGLSADGPGALTLFDPS